VLCGGWSRPLRAIVGWLLRPWVAVAAFSVVMLAWHAPSLFDLAQNNHAVHIWLMYASLFLAGVLFWLQFIGSPPFRMRMPPVSQATALIATTIVMWILAMSMSLFTQVPGIRSTTTSPGSPFPRSPTSRSAPGSSGCARTSGPSPA